MKNFIFRIVLIFTAVVGVTFLMFNYLFYNSSTSRGSRATGETMTLSFNPATANLTTDGQEVTTTIKVKSSVVMVTRGYYFKVNFDKTKVQIKDLNYKLGTVSAGLGQTNTDLTKINTDGFIIIQGEDKTVAGAAFANTTSFIDVVSIKFARKASGGNNLTIDKDKVYFYKKIIADNSLAIIKGSSDALLYINGGIVTPTPIAYKCNCTSGYGACGNFAGYTNIKYRECTANISGTFNCMLYSGKYYNYVSCNTPTSTGGVNVKLKIKLKIQGIAGKPAGALNSLNIKFSLYNENTEKYTDNDGSVFTAGDDGVWSGDVDFNNVISSHKYTLFVKGPYQVRKKVCDETPKETDGGTYRCTRGVVTLKKGDNNLDLSGIILLSGDLPTQDGTINAYDTSLIRNNIGTTDDKCDVNRDGKCDTQDYSLLISTLSIKNDE